MMIPGDSIIFLILLGLGNVGHPRMTRILEDTMSCSKVANQTQLYLSLDDDSGFPSIDKASFPPKIEDKLLKERKIPEI